MMKNAGIAIGLSMLGLGIAINGLNLNGNQASATPATYNAGPEEPNIVWYGNHAVIDGNFRLSTSVLLRAWSDGTLEAKIISHQSVGSTSAQFYSCEGSSPCIGDWVVVSSPTEGLNAAADINFDEIVDGADMGLLLGNWGKAPRSPIPASSCPLGLMQ